MINNAIRKYEILEWQKINSEQSKLTYLLLLLFNMQEYSMFNSGYKRPILISSPQTECTLFDKSLIKSEAISFLF